MKWIAIEEELPMLGDLVVINTARNNIFVGARVGIDETWKWVIQFHAPKEDKFSDGVCVISLPNDFDDFIIQWIKLPAIPKMKIKENDALKSEKLLSERFEEEILRHLYINLQLALSKDK